MLQPPRLVRFVLARLLGQGTVGRSVLGDLDDEFRDRAAADVASARRWYWREAVGISVRARTFARRDGRFERTRLESGFRKGGDSMIQMFWLDVRDAFRQLRGQPRFALTASLTLALGIGAATSIFSVVNGVLLEPLPYAHASRIVNVWSHAPGLGYDRFPLSPDLYFFYRAHNDVFEDMATFQTRRANLTELETPQVIDIAAASRTYFQTLGVPFAMGRSFSAEEDRPDGPAVAIISDRFWIRRLGSRQDAIGSTIRLDGMVRQVVGVAPAWIDEAQSPDVWIPAALDEAQPLAGVFSWRVIARLKPQVRPGDAAAHLEPLVQRAMEETITAPTYRAFMRDGRYRPLVHVMQEDLVGRVRQPLWVLLGTVGLVLLIACANVANLMLIRAEARQKEIAVRVALGSSRANLVRKLLTEAGLLSLVGSTLGVLCSAALLPLLLRLAPAGIPRLDRVGLDGTVILFAIGAGLVSALAFGLAPAIRYTRPGMLAWLRQGGRSGMDGPSRRRARNLLVVVQTALALVLLVGSGLMLRSFSRMMNVDLGFDPSSTMTFRVALPATEYVEAAQVQRFEEDLLERLGAIGEAGGSSNLPILAGSAGAAFDFDGQPIEIGQMPPMLHFSTTTPGFFGAMRIRMLQGRDFDNRDRDPEVFSVVVNQALADQFWPGADPIGKRLRPASQQQNGPWMTVVGVVQTVRQDGVREAARPLVYYPNNQRFPQRLLTFVVRGPNIEMRADELRRAVWAVDADLPVAAMQTLDSIIEDSIVEFTFTTLTLAIASGMALLLGAIGLYGVLSYAVSLRTREIGVRLALGAPPSRVLRGVIVSGVSITAVGLLLGLAGAAGLSRFLRGILYEVEPLDPLTFAGMSAALALVGLAASYFPARRAAAVSPLESLRTE